MNELELHVEELECDNKSPMEAPLEDTEERDGAAAQEVCEQPPSELELALAKQEEYLNLAQRVQADFENYKKRNAGVRKEAFEDGKIDFARGMLPIIDNFERAIGASTDEQDPLLIGIRMVYRQILDLLEKNNIQTIDRQGEPFDPELEEAVTQGNPEDGEPGTVCAVLQKGYRLNKTILRHSMVKVVPQ